LEDFFINNAGAEQIAAVIIEPVAGEGGFIVPPEGYFPKLAEICKEHGIVLIIDEVQSGICRTGKLFAIEHWGVEPDILLLAKSLGGGLPLASVTGRSEMMDAPHVGGLGGTYGGNPLACRSALAVLEMVKKDKLVEKAQRVGKKIETALTEWQGCYDIIGDVRGLGAMMAAELVTDRKSKDPAAEQTKQIVAQCREQGLLTLSCGNYGNVIRILAPLIISDEKLEKGLSILEAAIKRANDSI
jgi:4-aminobutyrate aminotransferase/(S)-3-amino-2-methylpropionate transaminase